MSQTPQLSSLGGLTLLMVSSLTIMVGCVIVPGLPSIAPALGVGGAAGWLVTLPSVGVVLFAPLAGRMIDRMGARSSLCIGLGVYGLLGLATVALHGIVPVFAARILLGGATALLMAGGTGLIAHFYVGEARIAMIARQGMAIELGGVVFLFAGGVLATFAWFAPFALYAMGFAFLVMVMAFVPAVRPSPQDESAVAGAAVRPLTAVYGAALLSMICFFSAVITLPFRLPAFGLGEAGTGYLLSFVSLVAVGAAACMPSAVRRLGECGVLILAFAAYSAAHLCFAMAPGLQLIFAGSILLGIGFGLSVPLVNVMTVERSPPAERGRKLASLAMAIFLGQFLASFMEFLPQGTVAPFLAASMLAFVAGALSIVHPGLRSRSQPILPSSTR
jgi:MFS family permease